MRRRLLLALVAIAPQVVVASSALAAKARPKAPAPATPSAAPMAPLPTSGSESPSHWLDDDLGKQDKHAASGLGFFAIGSFVLLLSGGAIVLLYRKGPRALAQVGGQERIDLLAVRSLGGRQKLVLVETVGERLLIAVGETDATLISHLPGGTLSTAAEADGDVGFQEAARAAATIEQATAAPAAPPAFAQAPAKAATAPAASAASAASSARWMPEPNEIFRDPHGHTAAQPPAAAPQRSLENADVAGLSRWRGEAAHPHRTPS